MNGILWLASYLKSGNTWVRVLLTNYLRNAPAPADIHDLEGGPIASSRALFDEWAGVAAADLTPAQVESCRPLVYERLAAENKGTLSLKIHDAFLRPAEGAPTVTAAATRCVFYLVRNPLDVAVSLAFHMGVSAARAVAVMNDPDHVLAGSGRSLAVQLPQRVLTWSGHVTSWLDDSRLPLHLVRYEDLHRVPDAALAGMLAFAGLDPDPLRVARAVAQSRFEVLQAQEARHGFREQHDPAEPFFRKGRVGDWRNHLTPAQADRIVADHGPVMRRLGYLSATGEPVF